MSNEVMRTVSTFSTAQSSVGNLYLTLCGVHIESNKQPFYQSKCLVGRANSHPHLEIIKSSSITTLHHGGNRGLMGNLDFLLPRAVIERSSDIHCQLRRAAKTKDLYSIQFHNIEPKMSRIQLQITHHTKNQENFNMN